MWHQLHWHAATSSEPSCPVLVRWRRLGRGSGGLRCRFSRCGVLVADQVHVRPWLRCMRHTGCKATHRPWRQCQLEIIRAQCTAIATLGTPTPCSFMLAAFCSTQEDTGSDDLTWQACWPKPGKTNESLADVNQLLYDTDCGYSLSFSDDDPASFQEALDELWSDSSAECKVRFLLACACRSRTRMRLRCEDLKRVVNATLLLTRKLYATSHRFSSSVALPFSSQIEMVQPMSNDGSATRPHR